MRAGFVCVATHVELSTNCFSVHLHFKDVLSCVRRSFGVLLETHLCKLICSEALCTVKFMINIHQHPSPEQTPGHLNY